MCSCSFAEEYSLDSERSTGKTSHILLNSIFARETGCAKRKSYTATCWLMSIKAARITNTLKENF